MGSRAIHKLFLVLIILLCSLHCHTILAQHQLETDALYALKANFNDPFLNVNWNGPQCPLRFPTQWYGIRCANGRVSGILLEDMGLTGGVSIDAFSVFTELTILSFKNNSISGEVMDFSSNANIRQINLSGNKFQGPIPRSLLSLNSLESLQLQDNNLTGSIPEFHQSNLKVFNVSNNNFQGEITKTPILQSFGFDCYSSNSELCGSPTNTVCNILNDTADTNSKTTTSTEPEQGSSKPNKLGIMFLLFDLVGLIAVILLFILYFRKAKKLKKMLKKHGIEERKQKEEAADEDYDDLEEEQSKSINISASHAHGKEVVVRGEEKGNLTFLDENVRFELNDLLKASAEGLGKGIFGNTYKAMMEGIPAVVVKRLRDLKPLSIEEFMKQLNIIADQRHPNLLPLLAYYYSKEEKWMMYKFAENGNLFNRIHGGRGNKDRIPFRWSARLSVARGVARALEYLHLNKPQSLVLHGNLKSSNVLLDENETVLVTDYGLTSLIAIPIASNRMASYKSPEYQSSKRVTRKSDVWSYGCVLLELLTGRVPAHLAPLGTNGVDLCSWVHRAVREEWTAEIFDIEISVQRNSTAGMLKLLQVAIRCCEKSPEKRPEMTQIVREVDNIKDVESDEEDLSSLDQSLTDESLSTSASGIISEER